MHTMFLSLLTIDKRVTRDVGRGASWCSLLEAQQNYLRLGAREKRLTGPARAPLPDALEVSPLLRTGPFSFCLSLCMLVGCSHAHRGVRHFFASRGLRQG